MNKCFLLFFFSAAAGPAGHRPVQPGAGPKIPEGDGPQEKVPQRTRWTQRWFSRSYPKSMMYNLLSRLMFFSKLYDDNNNNICDCDIFVKPQETFVSLRVFVLGLRRMGRERRPRSWLTLILRMMASLTSCTKVAHRRLTLTRLSTRAYLRLR